MALFIAWNSFNTLIDLPSTSWWQATKKFPKYVARIGLILSCAAFSKLPKIDSEAVLGQNSFALQKVG